jgi:hypothetical protein
MGHEVAEGRTKNYREIEEVIARAIKKVGAKKANDLCRYIPVETGGYLHHFTLNKMRSKQPHELGSMIEKFIINVDRPNAVAPKKRAPRGSRKKRDQITFTRLQLERLLHFARVSNDREMVAMLSPKRPLAHCKRDLIASVRHTKVDPELWNAYVEAVNAQQAAVSLNEMMLAQQAQPK